MGRYVDFVDGAPIVDGIEVVVTTGDLDCPGTALEVWSPEGRELFHVVVDSTGEMYLLFLSEGYRLSLKRMQEIIAKAQTEVRLVEESR